MAHLHEIRDFDSHYIIDPVTMQITNENSVKNTLRLGEHNSEILTFEIAKIIEGHDMSLCDTVRIHYINISTNKVDQSKDVYEVQNIQIAEDDAETLVFSWVVSENATKYAGSLNFRILFACKDASGKYTYKKWTEVFKGISISDGFDNGETVIEQYSDILEQWKAEIDKKIENSQVSYEEIAQFFERYLAENTVGSTSKIGEALLAASGWVGDASPYSQVVNIDGVTENSQVDLTPSVEQLAIFYEKDLAFVTENEAGIVTVYAIGQKPQNDYTIQVTITEVY